MANTNWQNGKAKGRNQAKAWLRHNDTEERIEVNHSNPDIREDLTHWNYEVGSTASLSYDEKCKRIDARLDTLNYVEGKGKNRRVSMQAICIYPPDDLLEYDEELDVYKSTDELKRWFEEAANEWEKFAGKENVMGVTAHFDEQHWYYPKGSKTKVLSKPHVHGDAIPEVDGRISGKAFSSRARMIEFNNLLEEMTRDKFGISYNSGKGKNSHGSKTVEELKAESERLDRAQEALEDAIEALKESEAELQEVAAEKEELEHKIEGMNEAHKQALEEQRKDLRADFDSQVNELKSEFDNQRKELEAGYQESAKKLDAEYKQKFHDYEVQANAVNRHIEYIKGVADGHEERANKYQALAKERRHKAAIAHQDFTSWDRKVQTRKKQYQQYGEKMNLKEEELKHSDEMIAEAGNIDGYVEEILGKFDSPEDAENYLSDTLSFSNELANSTDSVSRSWSDLLDDLKQMKLSKKTQEKVDAVNTHIARSVDIGGVVRIKAKSVLQMLQGSAVFKKVREGFDKAKEKFTKSKEQEERIMVVTDEVVSTDKGNELEI